MKTVTAAPAALAVALLVALTPSSRATVAVRVAASVFPMASVAAEIGGERVETTTIVPPGADPHHFELTPTKAKALERADVVLLVGGQFDPWAAAMHGGKRAPATGPVVVRFNKIFQDSLITVGASFNPHFWLDPLFARAMAEHVSGVLSAVDSAGAGYYRARFEGFASQIDSLDAAIRLRLDGAGFAQFVAFHPAWTYFARRYGLREAAVIELAPEQEPSARWIAEVVGRMKAEGLRFILAEEFSNPVLARTIADETGATVLVLDPLGGTERPGRDSYISLLGYNVGIMERAAREAVRR